MELRLLPIDALSHDERGACTGYSHTLLELGHVRDSYEDFRSMRSLEQLPDGHDVSSYVGKPIEGGSHDGERGYGTLDTDVYGNRYAWATAADILGVLARHGIGASARGVAVTAYLAALKPTTLIVLDWH